MPTPTKGARLGAGPAHQRLLLAGLATALFEHGRITTTEAKARRLRPYAERLITKAKQGDLHARRQVLRVIRDKGVVHVLFTQIGPRYENRHGGYTRITKIGPRRGDNAPMAVIELVEPLAEQTVAEAEGATRAAAVERTGAGRLPRLRPTSATSAETPTAPPVPDSAEEAAVAEAERAQDAAAAGDVEGAVDAAAAAEEAADEAGTPEAEQAAEIASDAVDDAVDRSAGTPETGA